MTTTSNPPGPAARPDIIVVNDGQYRWGADREILLAAMEAQGWTHTSAHRWSEPEEEDDAYTVLCNEVPFVAGYGPQDDFDQDDHPTLTWAPDMNAWVYWPAIPVKHR